MSTLRMHITSKDYDDNGFEGNFMWVRESVGIRSRCDDLAGNCVRHVFENV